MPFDLADGMAILGRTPSTLHALLHNLDPRWTNATEGPETWSPFVIVGHLLHSEMTDWMPRARLIRAQGSSRRFTPFDRFAQLRESQGRTLAQLLQSFAQARSASLATLTEWALTDADLALEGEHPEFGPVTLRQLLATWVVHDLGHIAQITRVMAKQYRDAIGPWRAYLPIVDR
ncbi:MAG: DinB family protein [Gemmatimonadaceae bacterium]|nr:DinB family protein [Gemmatimonadaceae bacterium]